MKKAQVGPVALIFLVLMFLVMFFIWLGPFISGIMEETVEANHLTGIEAFMYENVNVFIVIFCIIGVMGYFYFSGGG